MDLPILSFEFDRATAVIRDFEGSNRWLNELADCFSDEAAYHAMLSQIVRFSDNYQRLVQGE